VVNAAAENKEAYREPACTRTCRGKPNTRMTAAPSKTLMTTASLLGFYDPGHFGGEGDFYNSIFIFSSPSLLVSERLCSLPTWCEKFHAATACRGLQFGCVSVEQREKHANPTWCMEFPNVPPFFFLFSPPQCFPLGSDFILSSLSSFLTQSSLMWVAVGRRSFMI